MSEQRITKNIVLGTNEQGEIIVLDGVFQYTDGFKGATGTCLVPVTQAEIDHALTDEQKTEWYEEIWRNDAKNTYGTTESLEDYAAAQDDDEYLEMRYEDYTDIDTADIAAVLGVAAPQRYTTIGGGRMFPRALEGVTFIDSDEVREAVALIQQYES